MRARVVFFWVFVISILLLKFTFFDYWTSVISIKFFHPYDVNETTTKEKQFATYKGNNFESNKSHHPDPENKKEKQQIKSEKPRLEFPYDEKCLYNSYPNYNPPPFDQKDFDFLQTEEGKNYKTILAYNHAFQRDYYLGFGYKLFESACCKEKRCFFTDQRTNISIENFDAVLFHFRGLNHRSDLPKQRKKNQRWIFYDREPPTTKSTNPQNFEGLFNWTMTFRRDSDIIVGYGRIYPYSVFSNKNHSKFERKSPSLEESMKTKTKIVAWMVSKCNVPSKRRNYVRDLQKYIQVDIYGMCGPLECDRGNNTNCYEMIEKNYKFYLSFENSFCTDYVTEKFFNILEYNIVPVVRGSGDYASLAPPHSYIDARNYTPLELANYLDYLDKNNTAYLEYFKWRPDYFSLTMNWVRHAGSFCDLCYKLHNDPKEKVYYNLKDWFHTKSKCM